MDFDIMKHYRERQNRKNKVDSRLVRSEIRSIHGNKRKPNFATDRTPKAMGQ